MNGQDYYFVTKEEFECDIEQDRFLEYGELKGCYYGTAFSSIKRIMESRHVPVLELHPQVCVYSLYTEQRFAKALSYSVCISPNCTGGVGDLSRHDV